MYTGWRHGDPSVQREFERIVQRIRQVEDQLPAIQKAAASTASTEAPQTPVSPMAIVSGVVWLNKLPTYDDPLSYCIPSNGYYGYGVFNDIYHGFGLTNKDSYVIELVDLNQNVWDTRDVDDEEPDGLIIASLLQQDFSGNHEALNGDTIRVYGTYKPEIMIGENKLVTYRGRVVTNLLFRYTIIGNVGDRDVSNVPEGFPNLGRYVLIAPDGTPWAITVGTDGAITTERYGAVFQANQLMLGTRPHIWILRVDNDGVLYTDYIGDYEGVTIVMIEKDTDGIYWEITVDGVGTLVTEGI